MSLLKIGAGTIMRLYQKAALKAFDNGIKYIVLCWSRRAGKSMFAWNLLVREAVRNPGTYWYCFDNYSTAYNDIWIAMTSKGVKFLDMIPPDMVVRMNSAKMEVELTNGSVIKLIGINKADKLVGAGLNGVVFDEYAVLNPNSIELVTAMLAETGGWRVIISTPRGKNHFYEKYNFALAHPEFAYVSNMHCGMEEVAQYMAPGFLEQERLEIISKYGNDALFQQEYMTSWVSPNSGSVFGALAKIMKEEGRVTPILPNPNYPCYAAWDLGNADYTSIVLFQVDEKGFPTVIDHIENRNEDVTWYIGEWKEKGWAVHTHFLPHDAAHRKGARNESYKKALEIEGVRNTVVLAKPNRIEDKLNFLRRVFVGLKIDERLDRIVTCLDKLEYEWNEKLHIWSSSPTHKGGYSDTVDSLCYMAQAIQKYNITATNEFSTAHVREANPVQSTKAAKAERLRQLMEQELTLGGGKSQGNNNLSMFV
jgi:phage terminase large subunit